MDYAIMIEGQHGLNWPRWQRLARLVEDLGFAGLYRSDHYTNARPPDLDSLELWVSLGWLASHTRRLEFGPLVSPVSFRHPTMTARMASAVDDLSGGRLTLGLGAGWQEREHHNYGWELLSVDGRMRRFEEGLEVVTLLLQQDEPVTFQGEFYRVNEAVLLPRPQRPGGPPILIGGNGRHRTLPLVARYATQWNAVFVPPDRFAALSAQLDKLLVARGRAPASVRRSLMTGTLFGRDQAEFQRVLGSRDLQQARASGVLCGTPAEFQDQLSRLAVAGVQRVMLQWLDLDDLDRLEGLARALLG
jgi:F420-dependent oxidoreductase-like protein